MAIPFNFDTILPDGTRLGDQKMPDGTRCEDYYKAQEKAHDEKLRAEDEKRARRVAGAAPPQEARQGQRDPPPAPPRCFYGTSDPIRYLRDNQDDES
jgi:hypothetical protein